MRKVITLSAILIFIFSSKVFSQTISASTYPFTISSGVVLEDLSVGATQLVAPNVDDGAGVGLVNIGFDFWFVGVRYSQFCATANGYVRLGTLITAGSTDYTNVIGAGASQFPVLAAYWDDLWTGTN